MPPNKIEYDKFLENVNTIVEAWGTGPHNDGLWETPSWSDHLLQYIGKEVWDFQTQRVQEEAIQAIARQPKPDIYDVHFPSIERFKTIGIILGQQSPYLQFSWLRRQTTWEFERLTALTTFHLMRTKRPKNLNKLKDDWLDKLRSERQFGSDGETQLYRGWVASIESVAQRMFNTQRKEQIIGAIGVCAKIAKLTNAKEFGEEISAKLLIESYLPNLNQFRTLCHIPLEDIQRKLAQQKRRASSVSQQRPVFTSSHQGNQSSSNVFSPIDRADDPQGMIETIAGNYGRMDRKSEDEARDRLTSLRKAATSGNVVDERVVEYLRRLKHRTLYQLPYVLPETIEKMLESSDYRKL